MKYKIIVILLLSIVFSACNLLPFVKYYTTTKDGKFPKFKKKDYLAGSNNEYRSCYNVTFYDLDIDVNPEKKYLKGNMGINFFVEKEQDTLFIDLHRAYKINSIILNNRQEIKWKRKSNLIYVLFDQPLNEGMQNKLDVNYEGKPPNLLNQGPVHWKKDTDGNHWISTTTEGIGAHFIMPCKNLLIDEPDSLRMNITVPEGLIAVGNGRLTNREVINNKESFEWFVRNPINVYNIAFNIGNFKHIEILYSNSADTHQLRFYVLPYHYDVALEYFEQCVDIIEFYETTYGEYPWWNDGFKIIEASYVVGSGMEHQSAITVGLSYKNNFFDYSSLLIHEIAHEWWGNSVSMKDYSDIWLHEGFATYNEILFMEKKYGKYQYNHFIDSYKRHVFNSRSLIKPLNVNYCPFIHPKDLDVYKKGALLLHTLRYCIDNDSLFFDVLKSFYMKFKKTNIETSDFVEHVNEKTNQDFTWLFNQYLFDYKIPELHYFFEKENDESVFNYQWKNTTSEFKLPINIISNSDTIVLYPGLELKSMRFKNADTIHFDRNNGYIKMIEKNFEK